MARDSSAGPRGAQRFTTSHLREQVGVNLARRFDNTLRIGGGGDVDEHIAATYATLRRGLAVVAWLFPFVLWWYGNVFGIALLDSMSAYYYPQEPRGSLDPWPALWLCPLASGSYVVYRFATGRGISATGWAKLAGAVLAYLALVLFLYRSETLEVMYYYTPMRTIFVGFLCVTGASLFFYKGFTSLEDLLLDVAGVGAMLVALFPTTDPTCNVEKALPDAGAAAAGICQEFKFPSLFGLDLSWHFIFAGLFFLGGALSIFATAHKTLDVAAERGSISHHDWYKRFYRGMGGLMLAFPLLAWVLTRANAAGEHVIFAVETGGMLAFAAYWWVKSDEIKASRVDRPAASVRSESGPGGDIGGRGRNSRRRRKGAAVS